MNHYVRDSQASYRRGYSGAATATTRQSPGSSSRGRAVDGCLAAAGWATLRPIDIAQGPEDKLLDPQTLRIVLAVIRGGYVTLVHLGPRSRPVRAR